MSALIATALREHLAQGAPSDAMVDEGAGEGRHQVAPGAGRVDDVMSLIGSTGHEEELAELYLSSLRADVDAKEALARKQVAEASRIEAEVEGMRLANDATARRADIEADVREVTDAVVSDTVAKHAVVLPSEAAHMRNFAYDRARARANARAMAGTERPEPLARASHEAGAVDVSVASDGKRRLVPPAVEAEPPSESRVSTDDFATTSVDGRAVVVSDAVAADAPEPEPVVGENPEAAPQVEVKAQVEAEGTTFVPDMAGVSDVSPDVEASLAQSQAWSSPRDADEPDSDVDDDPYEEESPEDAPRVDEDSDDDLDDDDGFVDDAQAEPRADADGIPDPEPGDVPDIFLD